MAKYNYDEMLSVTKSFALKSEQATALNISRPTLNLWLKKFERDNDLINEHSYRDAFLNMGEYALRAFHDASNFDETLITEMLTQDDFKILASRLMEQGIK